MTLRPAKTKVSLNAMIGGGVKTASEIVEQESAESAVSERRVDATCESKLREAKSRFVDRLMDGRPRYGVIFETMSVEGNVVTVSVPSQELHDDLMRNSREWMGELAAVAGVSGYIELRVVVNERVKSARPITLEDRLRHLTSQNDKLAEMIERLNLDGI